MLHATILAVGDALARLGELRVADILVVAGLLALGRRFVRGSDDAVTPDVLLGVRCRKRRSTVPRAGSADALVEAVSAAFAVSPRAASSKHARADIFIRISFRNWVSSGRQVLPRCWPVPRARLEAAPRAMRLATMAQAARVLLRRMSTRRSVCFAAAPSTTQVWRPDRVPCCFPWQSHALGRDCGPQRQDRRTIDADRFDLHRAVMPASVGRRQKNAHLPTIMRRSGQAGTLLGGTKYYL